MKAIWKGRLPSCLQVQKSMSVLPGRPSALFIFILQNARSEITGVLYTEIIFLIDTALYTNINSFIQQIVLGNTALT